MKTQLIKTIHSVLLLVSLTISFSCQENINDNAANTRTSDGTISGWNNGTAAVKKVDQLPSASYLGVTMANIGNEFFLYVANFAQNKIEVYD